MEDGVLRALAEARALGFLGPGPIGAHLDSARLFAAAMADIDLSHRPALDLGAGGGVPGLILAGLLPATTWLLLDKHRRRTSFLARVVAELGWGARVAVRRQAAEEAAHDARLRSSFAVVTSRSFGPPAVTAECAAGFLSDAGVLLVSEPPTAEPARWDTSGLAALGLVRDGTIEGTTGSIARFRRLGALPELVPRPRRDQAKRPTW